LHRDLARDTVKNLLLSSGLVEMTGGLGRVALSRMAPAWSMPGAVIVSAACVFLGAAGCASPASAPVLDAGVVHGGPQVNFRLSAGILPFGDIPFPDDLYRDEVAGTIAVGAGAVFEAANALVEEMLGDLGDVPGFSPVAPIFMRIDGGIDATTLPGDAAASMREDASVFLLDIDPSSPGAFSRVPIECRWSAGRGLLTARPARGEPLSGGRKYALVATRRVLGLEGDPLRPSETYRAVLEATGVPEDPLVARAYRAHASAIAALVNVGVPKEEIAALAVFTVQDVAAGLSALVRGAEAFGVSAPTVTQALSGTELDAVLGVPSSLGVGVDAQGGVQHENVGWLIQGTVDVPNYLAGVATNVGRFEIGVDNLYTTRRVELTPFTLSLPIIPSTTDAIELPLVVFLHGLGRDRADVLPLANQLNAAGYAVLAIDAPYHGLRRPGATDSTHRFTSGPGADGLADAGSQDSVAWFLGALDAGGDRAPLHPAFVRDAIRQNVADWLVVLRAFAKDPAWIASLPGLSAVSIGTERVGLVGVDVGGQVGALLSSHDARFDANIFAFTGAGVSEWLLDSPVFAAMERSLASSVGDIATGGAPVDPLLHSPAIALWQTLVDGGDALAFASALRRQPREVLLVSSMADELLGLRATEAFAGSLRLPLVGDTTAQYVTLGRASAPVSDNTTIASELKTQAFFTYDSATRALYSLERDVLRFDATATPPFRQRAEPLTVTNPIDQALTQAVFFFESWRSGTATVIDPNAQLARSQ